jgi:hypothetical protein
MGRSAGRDDPAVFVRPQVVRVSLWAVFGLWLARRVTRLVLLIVRSPAAIGAILLTAAFVAGWQLVHPALPLGVVGGLLAGLVVWRLRWPVSFDAHAYVRGRSWWRGSVVYRRRWTAAMDTVGLTKERHGTDYVPPLLAVQSNRWMDTVTVRMLPGQRVQDYVDVADRLAQTFGALDCRVRTCRNPHRVQLWLLVRDPLASVVDPFDADPIWAIIAGLAHLWEQDGQTEARRLPRSPHPRPGRRGCPPNDTDPYLAPVVDLDSAKYATKAAADLRPGRSGRKAPREKSRQLGRGGRRGDASPRPYGPK